jgi:adenylate kinase family enzyme
LAARLAEKLGAAFIELDELHWEPGWVEAPQDVFRERVRLAASAPTWVAAGNYHVVRDLLWSRAEAVVWLDYPLPVVFWRLFSRTLYRSISRQVLWNGNRESMWTHLRLWSPDSLFNWLFRTYWRRKREYPAILARPEFAHLRLIHFKHPREARPWLQGISPSQTRPSTGTGRAGPAAPGRPSTRR